MEVINKIVISTNPPRENYVLWANPNTHQLYYWNNGWQTFFYDKKDEKQNKYDLNLLTKRKEITGAINELFSMVNGMDITIDLTPIAKEATLIQGVGDVIKAVKNIDFTVLENSIAEVKNAVVNIGFSALAKEDTLTQGLSSVESKVEEVKQAVDNIDLSPIETKVDEGVTTLSTKIDNIDLSAVENKVQEESAAIQNKLNNLNVEVDLTPVAKQGNNSDATMSAVLEEVMKLNGSFAEQIHNIVGE